MATGTDKVIQKRSYSTDVREKIKRGEHFALQLVLDDDNALALYHLKQSDPNGVKYVKIINTAVRLHLKTISRKKRKK